MSTVGGLNSRAIRRISVSNSETELICIDALSSRKGKMPTFSALVGHLAAPDESFRLAAAVRMERVLRVLLVLVLLEMVLVLQVAEGGQPLVLLINRAGRQDVALVAADAAQFEGPLHGRVPPLLEFRQL